MRRHHDPLCRIRVTAAASVVIALLILGSAPSCFAQQSGQPSFVSAEAASSALASAVQNHDATAIMTILGAGGELIHEDDVEDRLLHERFVTKYRQMHRLVREPDGATILYIGAENWPFPVPFVASNGAWRFDTQAGLMEVLFRRIGENEAMAIQACKALIASGAALGTAPTGTARSGRCWQTHPRREPTPYYGYYFRSHAVEAGRTRRRQAQGCRRHRLSRRVSVVRRDDVQGRSRRRRVWKRSRPQHGGGRWRDDG